MSLHWSMSALTSTLPASGSITSTSSSQSEQQDHQWVRRGKRRGGWGRREEKTNLFITISRSSKLCGKHLACQHSNLLQLLMADPNPSIRQTTVASSYPKQSSHTLPHSPVARLRISTVPSLMPQDPFMYRRTGYVQLMGGTVCVCVCVGCILRTLPNFHKSSYTPCFLEYYML